ncbi:MAG: hypothetical protein PHF44_02455 [Candidatus Pacebacteria bacterium]|nr:hypothetical protein [Candidatus Paceibacterota bacterium]
MKDFEIDILVDLIVDRARIDTTFPDPKNQWVGWLTDVLFQIVDRFVAIDLNDPKTFAEIGRRVSLRVRDLPEMGALACLAILRGERLLPVSPEREEFVLQIARETKNIITNLPDSTRKLRLESLFYYHMGIFYSNYEHFDLAEEAQRKSAEIATIIGDKTGAAIAYFMETLCQLRNALLKGIETKEIFSELEKRFLILVDATKGSSVEVQWGQINGPIHMIETTIWLNQMSNPDLKNWVAMVIAAADRMTGSSEIATSAEFVRAIDIYSKGDPNAFEVLRAVGEGKDANEVKVTALLVLIRHAIRAQKIDEAKDILKQMPKQEAQHVRAIAERMLSK